MTTAGNSERPGLLSMERIIAKAIQCVLVVAAVVCVGCAQVIPEALGLRFWGFVWLGLTLITEPVALILMWRAPKRAPGKEASEWLRAATFALLPSAVLLAFWLVMRGTFGT